MANILIADDHEIFRKGVKQLLLETTEKYNIDEAENGQEVIERMWMKEYDAVLLDVSMPGRNGLEVLRDIKSIKPELNVLMLSMYPEEQIGMRAIKASAHGYLMKSTKPDELVRAVKAVVNGRKYISSSLAERLACYVEHGNTKALHDALSDREYAVMCMTASGKPVKQIALELSLSDKTISTYRARILYKMNMTSIAQLIKYVIKKDLLNQPDC